MNTTWFVIVNPTAGKAKSEKTLGLLSSLLTQANIDFILTKTTKAFEEKSIVQNAIKQGYRRVLVVGGDGTIHHTINGIMSQQFIKPNEITFSALPFGTGNDWLKSYGFPKQLKKCIQSIQKHETIFQDIGQMLLHNEEKTVFYNNVAGIGFDGFVAKKLIENKKYGALSYLISAGTSFFQYNNVRLQLQFNNQEFEVTSLLTLVGLCKFSGGGMQLTKDVVLDDGLFDVSVAKPFSFFEFIKNSRGFYNGKVLNTKNVDSYKTNKITIKNLSEEKAYIQADGELIGSDFVTFSILQKALKVLKK